MRRYLADPLTLLISLAPVLTYLFAYVYELGFAHFYDFPPELINLQLSNFFIVGGILVMFVPLAYIFLALFIFRYRNSPRRLKDGPKRLLVIQKYSFFGAVLPIQVVLVSRQFNNSIGVLVIALSCFILIDFIWWFYKRTPQKSEFQRTLRRGGVIGVEKSLFSSAAEATYHLLSVLTVLLLFTYNLGFSELIGKNKIITINNGEQELEVLRIYGREAVTQPPIQERDHNNPKDFYVIDLRELNPPKIKVFEYDHPFSIFR